MRRFDCPDCPFACSTNLMLTAHRMEWIAEVIHVYGFVNRQHIQRKFGLSTPQASIDLRDFQRLNPTLVVYDISAKRYVATWALKEKR